MALPYVPPFINENYFYLPRSGFLKATPLRIYQSGWRKNNLLFLTSGWKNLDKRWFFPTGVVFKNHGRWEKKLP
jgi:hypothetical protein